MRTEVFSPDVFFARTWESYFLNCCVFRPLKQKNSFSIVAFLATKEKTRPEGFFLRTKVFFAAETKKSIRTFLFVYCCVFFATKAKKHSVYCCVFSVCLHDCLGLDSATHTLCQESTTPPNKKKDNKIEFQRPTSGAEVHQPTPFSEESHSHWSKVLGISQFGTCLELLLQRR